MYSYVNGIHIPVTTKNVSKDADYGYSTFAVEKVSMTRWLLSYQEAGFTGTDYVKVEGTAYPLFTSDAKRTEVGAASIWWLRSSDASSSDIFFCVGDGGYSNHGYTHYTSGVVFGFCF